MCTILEPVTNLLECLYKWMPLQLVYIIAMLKNLRLPYKMSLICNAEVNIKFNDVIAVTLLYKVRKLVHFSFTILILIRHLLTM